MRFIRLSLSILVAFSIVFSGIFIPCEAATLSQSGTSTGTALPGGSAPINVPIQKKATIDLKKISSFDKSGKRTTSALQIAQKYYNRSKPKVEPTLKLAYSALITGTVAFNGKYVNEKNAHILVNNSSAAIQTGSGINFSVAVASVAFAWAPKDNFSAHNLAAALYVLNGIKSEKVNTLADAAALYEYAVSADPKNADTLVNLGNVYMDQHRQEDAKIVFTAALQLIPGYYPACEGMATYWLVKGDKAKAAKYLQKGMAVMPTSTQTATDDTKVIADPQRAPITLPSDSEDTAKENIKKLSKINDLSTSDFISSFDPTDAKTIKDFLNNLPQSYKLALPSITPISQVSSYENYVKQEDCFEEFQEASNSFFQGWDEANSQAEQKADDLTDQALSAAASQSDLLAAAYASMGMTPGDKPTLESVIQGYNLQLIAKKLMAYDNYFNKLMDDYQTQLKDYQDQHGSRIENLNNEEDDALSKVQGDSPQADAERKKIRIQYAIQRNSAREEDFHKSFDYFVYQYINVVKPAIEAMWADCMPNVELISAEGLRAGNFNNVSGLAYSNAYRYMSMLMQSPLDTTWENVTSGDLNEAEDQLEAADQAKLQQQALDAMNAARVPDEFSFVAYIEKMNINVSCGCVTLKLNVHSIEVSGALLAAAKVGYNWDTNTFTGGLGIGLQLADPAGFGKVGVTTMLTMDYNASTGKVTEIDLKVNAKASASVDILGGKVEYSDSVMHGSNTTPSLYANMGGGYSVQ